MSFTCSVDKISFYHCGVALVLVAAVSYWNRRSNKEVQRPPKRPQKTILPKPQHGGDLVAEVLVKHNVKFLFTLIGGHVSPVIVAAKSRGIRVIDVRHEANAVFAADAVSRLSNSVGVACVTAGPGLTNTITAATNALLAHSPLVLLGGATLNILKGKGSLQDIDQHNLFRGVVKWQVSVSRVCDIIPALEEAFCRAQSGVPGPVFVELPLDVLYPEGLIRKQLLAKLQGKSGVINKVVYSYIQFYLRRLYGVGLLERQVQSMPWVVPRKRAVARQLRAVLNVLQKAERPVLVVGSQAMSEYDAFDNVVQAIRSLQIPTFLTGGARGCLGVEDNELHIRHKRSMALKRADVVLLLGVPCDFRLDYGFAIPSRTTLISVNVDRQQLYLNRRPTIPIQAHVPDFLIRLAECCMDEKPVNAKKWHSWRLELKHNDGKQNAEILEQSKVKLPPAKDSNGSRINVCNPLSICRTIDASLSDNSIVVCDGGDFIGTAAYTVRPRGPLSWLDPGPFGTLGIGAGFALGAKLVRPDANVWLLWGDGSAAFSIMEFDTFVRHNINVVAVVGNDACWTQIQRDQAKWFDDSVGCMLSYTNYDEVAEALGGKGFKVTSEDEMESIVKTGKKDAQTRPVLINVMLGKTSFRDGSISV